MLHTDGLAGFDSLFYHEDSTHQIREAACWSQVQRKFYDLHVATKWPPTWDEKKASCSPVPMPVASGLQLYSPLGAAKSNVPILR